ncbi:carbonic anhydrase 4-like [Xyrauchen texanus]|uniref:carbonic anhydrase 4-like n=1 Tax=Xyrauchen texanus TaxID=154827 RepID=UPI002242139E|nr:carbonic anhydrase 4-like [Xyrauchen texanus]
MESGRAPGVDGCPVDFYKAFWLELGADLLKVLNDSLSEALCYHMPSCSDVTWPIIARNSCNGNQQSPIDIVTADVQADACLTSFNFIGYDDDTTLTEIINTGKTIKVQLDHKKMYVEGGDLPGVFTSIQFHFHWGTGSAMPGSEHTVDGKQYPMALHIVNKAVADSHILAAFGFFIEATNDIGKPGSWKTLTSYLTKIANEGERAGITQFISMDDLLPGVDWTKYYCYFRSRSHACHESFA